jgi:cation diffusion facilitator CzcD-associated flavoprotein CzcO
MTIAIREDAPAAPGRQSDSGDVTDVAIIGAGPYGLSVACHLRARGVPFRIFGAPMKFWKDMPDISLKSFDFATNIYTPQRGYRFTEYCAARGISSAEPVAMSKFIEYGLWAQRELVPEVEDVRVTNVSRDGDVFVLALDTGETVRARRVVMAMGLTYFERMPEELRIDSPRISHSMKLKDYAQFAGKDVIIIGGGQSALESAQLLLEHGARPTVVVRADGVWFGDKFPEHRTLIERIKNPNTTMGPGMISWVLQTLPLIGHAMPERRRVRLTRRHLGPFGTWWVRDAVEGKVPVLGRTHLVAARDDGSGIVLTVRDDAGERELRADHVIAGTGYEVDVDRLPFLDPQLARAVERVERAPKLSRAFESSVAGLYFVGPSAMFSFGPLVRFVCGAEFTAPTVARRLARTRAKVAASR